MNSREQFLSNLRDSRVKVHKVPIDGWPTPVYLCQQTMGDVRSSMMQVGEDATDARQKIRDDPLFLARSLARLVRDENGDLLFDSSNDAQMAELMEVLKDAPPTISKQITDAYNAINAPTSLEVTTEGNSPSANPS